MFVLQGGERMKYKLLKDLYDCFYIPPELQAQKQEIEECHQALSEALGKPERRLVFQIIYWGCGVLVARTRRLTIPLRIFLLPFASILRGSFL